ncbi:thiol:disulfide interchange protein DsbA [Cricetibacter osteomyelitidis]|uniref:Thiol:disulfide interchange protein DsbA n=1 Tax=Cricetibacter osteomyelitidis TaxID=1521931 RepID=A0A4V6NS84_9PAST|nr:thiol:disulfide interchange protein DsbA/DsbL [Cricetibacter osteomyelitidis]TCP95783.1 thiol:disulfide interchange protein DsbA [Cricetibacter osteomyelitidis]
MDIRELSAALLLFFSPTVFADPVNAVESENTFEEQPHFEDGKDYFSYLEPIVELPRPDKKIVIRSFFAYDCSGCSSTHDVLELYSQINGNRVILKSHPVATEDAIFTPSIYFTLISLGREDLANLFLFENADKSNQQIKNKKFIHWLKKHKVEEEAFITTLKTPEIQQKIKSAIELTQKYGVFTIPFVVINGKYVLTQSTLYNDDYTFAVLDYLVDKVENERKK